MRNICDLKINSKPYSFDVEGEFFWGEDINLFVKEGNVISKTTWWEEGYSIFEKFLNANEFELFYSGLRNTIIDLIKENDIDFDERKFTLENYHNFVKSDEVHQKIISKTREFTFKDFDLDFNKILEKLQDHLGYKLTYWVEELKKVHIQVRINRPNSLDINPPHKDGYLSYWKDVLNVWMPISGCNNSTSLSLMPKSHLLSEKDLYRTENKGAKINGLPYMVPCILKTSKGNLKMIRPNPAKGQALIFTPFIIHGAAFNSSQFTRMALELRLPKSPDSQ